MTLCEIMTTYRSHSLNIIVHCRNTVIDNNDSNNSNRTISSSVSDDILCEMVLIIVYQANYNNVWV